MCCRRCNQDKSNLTLREWVTILQGRRDYRAKTVAALADDLDGGLLYFVPDVVDVIGLAPGLFA